MKKNFNNKATLLAAAALAATLAVIVTMSMQIKQEQDNGKTPEKTSNMIEDPRFHDAVCANAFKKLSKNQKEELIERFRFSHTKEYRAEWKPKFRTKEPQLKTRDCSDFMQHKAKLPLFTP